ncbi:hypothetical protein [Achromobacter xylosoxidans]|uniref:hypothetical protein n=1 Tax=Alcaligenes xylosoxydans xylosoxydans TaxID=85698 RepID=UPI003F76750A
MKIGPSFLSEIEAAGLAGKPFTWSQEGVDFGDAMNLDGTLSPNTALSQADRAAIEAIVAAHNPNDPAPLAVPESVTKYQCCVILARHGLLARTNSFFAGLALDDPRRLAWEMAPTAQRRSASTLDAIAHLGLSEAEVDAMFIEASQVN